ncbi:MAG: PSD1 and planctomycete cytochrome C domain-containing protein [Planctomycetota bacterium]|nr:PSD1 and planctomycete cytochrome C domain-containing protein [Planctomycetota bacterium]
MQALSDSLMTRLLKSPGLILFFCWCAAGFRAANGQRIIDFDQQVAPILVANCLECHTGPRAKGNLDLTTRRLMIQGGDSGPALVAGKPGKSPIWEKTFSGEMPPNQKLSAEEQSILKNWISQGAVWNSKPLDLFQWTTRSRGGYDWWSLQKLKAPAVPVLKDPPKLQNEIDAFVLTRLQKHGLHMSPRAKPRELVRRLYFDLLGLPPAATDVESFEKDPSQSRWAHLVDKLLASSHYGERWAQHWLDVARFGETQGYEYNQPRPAAYHYRDWVIQSLNKDLPYPQFVQMQIAGDLIQPGTWAGTAATGFLVAGVHNTVLGQSDVMKRASRHEELEEMAGTVAQTFLGLTANCARCHNHKFDPITTQEYYQFVAALDGVSHGVKKIPLVDTKTLSRLTEEKLRLHAQLMQQIQNRGGVISRSANVISLKQPIDANLQGESYTISVKASPTVWGIKQQATGAQDGLEFRILDPGNRLVASQKIKPASWQESGEQQRFRNFKFHYQGNGSGKVTLEIRSYPHEGRFGGAIDDLKITNSKREVLFQDNFDDLNDGNNSALQADTKLNVFWGQSSKRWNQSGLNPIHAVEYQKGNRAIQIFSGWLEKNLVPISQTEKNLAAQIRVIDQQLLETDLFSVVSRNPGPMRVLLRGDANLLGQEVVAGGLKSIVGTNPSFGVANTQPEGDRRLKLADWITDPNNGPFHRTLVNRIWHYHFGTGIVSSPNDLGFNGDRPSHPDLLEWLSVWFRNHNYSLKKLHRLILTSATWQQSSHAGTPEHYHQAKQVDHDNRLLWRQNPRRVDAEYLRDAILKIAGQLNPKPFGPGYVDVKIKTVGSAHYYRSFDPTGPPFNRRSIYRWRARGERSGLLESFDCPDPSVKTPKRSTTTTPSQVLSQWNHSFVLRMSSHLASQIQHLIPEGSDQDQINLAYRLVLNRLPTTREANTSVNFLREHKDLPLFCRVLFNCSEFVILE